MKKNIICRTLIKSFVYSAKYNEKKKKRNKLLKFKNLIKITKYKNNFQIYIIDQNY